MQGYAEDFPAGEKIQQKNYVLCFGEQNNRPQDFCL